VRTGRQIHHRRLLAERDGHSGMQAAVHHDIKGRRVLGARERDRHPLHVGDEIKAGTGRVPSPGLQFLGGCGREFGRRQTPRLPPWRTIEPF
jgi:hypothetical protein